MLWTYARKEPMGLREFLKAQAPAGCPPRETPVDCRQSTMHPVGHMELSDQLQKDGSGGGCKHAFGGLNALEVLGET